MHASCAARDGAGVLLVGPPGSGKSDLLLRLLARGFTLVADDQVDLSDGIASAPEALAGLLETRGLGITRLPHTSAPIRLVVALDQREERMPHPRTHDLGVPLIGLDPAQPSAPERVMLALDCATGRHSQLAGAFAA